MKTETQQHTPTPWHYNKEVSLHGTNLVYGNDGHLVADTGRINYRNTEESEANAALIVRAVNSHDELIEKLKDMVLRVEDMMNKKQFADASFYCAEIQSAKNAIAKAEGE